MAYVFFYTFFFFTSYTLFSFLRCYIFPTYYSTDVCTFAAVVLHVCGLLPTLGPLVLLFLCLYWQNTCTHRLFKHIYILIYWGICIIKSFMKLAPAFFISFFFFFTINSYHVWFSSSSGSFSVPLQISPGPRNQQELLNWLHCVFWFSGHFAYLQQQDGRRDC